MSRFIFTTPTILHSSYCTTRHHSALVTVSPIDLAQLAPGRPLLHLDEERHAQLRGALHAAAHEGAQPRRVRLRDLVRFGLGLGLGLGLGFVLGFVLGMG